MEKLENGKTSQVQDKVPTIDEIQHSVDRIISIKPKKDILSMIGYMILQSWEKERVKKLEKLYKNE